MSKFFALEHVHARVQGMSMMRTILKAYSHLTFFIWWTPILCIGVCVTKGVMLNFNVDANANVTCEQGLISVTS